MTETYAALVAYVAMLSGDVRLGKLATPDFWGLLSHMSLMSQRWI